MRCHAFNTFVLLGCWHNNQPPSPPPAHIWSLRKSAACTSYDSRGRLEAGWTTAREHCQRTRVRACACMCCVGVEWRAFQCGGQKQCASFKGRCLRNAAPQGRGGDQDDAFGRPRWPLKFWFVRLESLLRSESSVSGVSPEQPSLKSCKLLGRFSFRVGQFERSIASKTQKLICRNTSVKCAAWRRPSA